MATKKSVPKKKPVPPMYQEPTPISLGICKVKGIDATGTVLLESPGSPSPELAAAGLVSADGKEVQFKGTVSIVKDGHMVRMTIRDVENDPHRMDLNARLRKYLESCLLRTFPHLGDRPAYISEADWQSHDLRTKLLAEMPVDAPGEAHDALRAAKLIQKMVDALVIEDEWSDGIERVICMAIDLGKLLQRGQVQRDFGEQVAVGRRNTQSRSEANATQMNSREQLKIEAEKRFHVLMAKLNRDETKVLKTMAGGSWGYRGKEDEDLTQKKNADGVYETAPKWPSKSTLYKWKKDW